MSVQANIDVSYSEELEFLNVLATLESIGWTYNDYGKVSYLDNDDYEWKTSELDNAEEVKDLLSNRFDANQISAIVMVNDMDIGISIHFKSKVKVMLSLNINRKKLYENLTDFSYYLSNLKDILSNAESVVCSDIY